jgi:hypothetical protein
VFHHLLNVHVQLANKKGLKKNKNKNKESYKIVKKVNCKEKLIIYKN